MGRGETEPIPTPTRVLVEVRQGAVTTSINQEKQNRSQGDFWVVDKGSSFTVQNSGEVAVQFSGSSFVQDMILEFLTRPV